MASTARIDELKKKFDENPRRYFAPLANEFRKAGDIDQAIVICEEFLPQQPGHMSGHIVYGQALYEAGKLPESRAVFETALALDPENLIALRHLGDIAQAQDDLTAARGWFVRVLEADPRNEEIQGLIASIDSVGGAPAEASPADDAPGSSTMSEESDAPWASAANRREEAAELDLAPLPERPHFDPSLEDTQPMGIPAVPMSDAVVTPATLIEGFSLDHLEPPTHSDRTEGLEPGEFTAPDEHIHEIQGLDNSLDSGVPSFEPPSGHVAALDGLQGSGGMDAPETSSIVAEEEFEIGFPPILPAEDVATTVTPATNEPELLDFELPTIVAELSPEQVQPALDEQFPDVEMDFAPEPVIDVVEPPIVRAPFVTETMAELYLAQGLRDQARSVYEQLLAASPTDDRLRGIVLSLTPDAPTRRAGPTARDFFSRLATRRPGARAAAFAPPADDDFTSETEVARATDVAAVPDTQPDLSAPRTIAVTPAGSIDALFGNRSPGTSEDSAAAALAQAFGRSSGEMQAISGHAARPASAELSLDSVFKEGPARPQQRVSQTFSFDQFFSGGAGVTGERSSRAMPQRSSGELSGPAAPADRGTDDIEQFNSWLQGLKPR